MLWARGKRADEDAVPDRGLLQDRSQGCVLPGARGDFCGVEGCGTLAQRYGLCTAHGGQTKKPCHTERCGNLEMKGGFCQTHQVGGHPTCRVEECGKWSAKGGMCKQHFKEAQDAGN